MRKSSLLAAGLLALSVSPTLAGIAPGDRRVYLHGAGIDLSFIEGFLGDLGVEVDLPHISVDLPPRAESAVANALDRADAALNRVFGDGGVLDGIDVNVDGIVDDALSNAQSILEGINLPEVDLPDVGGILEDAVGRAEEALAGIDTVLPANTQQIVNDALQDAQQSVDAALNRVFGDGGVLDEIDDLVPAIDGLLDDLDAGGVLDDVLGAGGVVDRALSDLPIDRLPDAATEALENAAGIVEQVLGDLFGRHDHSDHQQDAEIASLVAQSEELLFRSSAFVMMPTTSSAASVPEPTTGVLALAGLALASARRRR